MAEWIEVLFGVILFGAQSSSPTVRGGEFHALYNTGMADRITILFVLRTLVDPRHIHWMGVSE